MKHEMAENIASSSSKEECRIYLGKNNSLLPQGNYQWKHNDTCIYFFCSSETRDKLQWYCYVVAGMCLASLVFGFLGNMTVLMNYIYYKKSWTSSTIFIFNLALSDFFWIITVPISVFFSINKSVLFSAPVFCQFKRIFFNINIYGSIFFLMLISFDRYLSSVHPLTSPRWWDKKKAKACTITIWLFIFVESTPDIYCILRSKHTDQDVTCMDYIIEPLSFVIPIAASRMIFGFLIPGMVMFTCYFGSLRVLVHLKDQSHSRRARKPLMLITVTLLVFLISFAPYHIMMMVILFYRCHYLIDSANVNLIFALYEISQIICSISFCADPIIFILANNKFKTHIRSMKCCSCCRSNRVGNIIQ